jgi:ABC-2 type transport system permease protein
MQAEDVSFADDTAKDADADRRKRVSAGNWRAMPDFTFATPSGGELTRGALPGLAIVLAWLAAAALLLGVATRRLGARR